MHTRFQQLLDWVGRMNATIQDYRYATDPAVTDAAVVGRRAGTTLLVARFGMNSVKEMLVCVQRLEQSGVNTKGVILNGVVKWQAKTLTATATITTVTTIRVTDYPAPARSDINAHCVCNENGRPSFRRQRQHTRGETKQQGGDNHHIVAGDIVPARRRKAPPRQRRCRVLPVPSGKPAGYVCRTYPAAPRQTRP